MSDELDNIPNDNGSETHDNDSHLHDVKSVSGMYQDWFLDYASYVILERAVPAIEDGLKPVQRRILHAMREIDDGRFNKVANVIGQTMQYHPHGDAAIGEAMVNLGQKELLIETQGNWGDVRTGDSAAAPRYIEARLSKFALEVAFNPQTTVWQTSYDGRKREPVNLPMKFPLLLAQGVEGIAVGLATKILPHNFIELCKASIDILKEKKIRLYPDFMMGGMIDVSNYNDGLRGGKVRVRAKIEEFDKKTLLIKDIPYGTTTTQLIDSIIKANDSGKIKIKKVVDNTAKHVEIQIQLAPGVSPDITIDALYAFTDCEVSISPNACLIISDKPHFIGVSEILKINTEQTRQLLKRELLIRLNELEEEWHFSSLEKLFIEKRIYRDIEECETWEAVLETIDKGLKPYKKLFRREITRDDVIGLTEIKIKRISKFDAFKADEHIKGVEKEMEEVHYNIEYLTDYTIAYFENLIKKYGKGRERHTEIRTFDAIQAKQVAAANVKLYVNRAEGFIGTTLKKDEFLCDCSDLDDIIIFRREGKYMVTKVAEKTFVGKDIIHAGVFHKSDERMAYNVIYDDGKTRYCFAKRFNVLGVTRDKEYDLTQGNKNSKIVYFTPNQNSESEIVTVTLHPSSKARKQVFDFDFGALAIKSRSVQGNLLCKYLVKTVKLKEKGSSTLGGRKIWYDEITGRLNTDERGIFLGTFDGDDAILVIYRDGSYELTNFDLTNRYEPNEIYLLEKFKPSRPISAVHTDGKVHYVKRFMIETTTLNKKFIFIGEERGCKLIFATTYKEPLVKVLIGKKKADAKVQDIKLHEFIEVKGWKSIGNKLADKDLFSVTLLNTEDNMEEDETRIAPPTATTIPLMDVPLSKEKKEIKPLVEVTVTNPEAVEKADKSGLKNFKKPSKKDQSKLF